MCVQRIVNRYIELPASKLVHFDHRFANRNSTWRKLIHVWGKRCAMQLAHFFFKWRRITPGPVRCGTFDPSRVTGFNNWSLIRLAVFFVVVVAQHAANCPQVCIKRIVNRDIELPASKLVHFDHRFANRNSTWRKLIHVWGKRCAMQLAHFFFKWRRITPGPVRCGTFDPSRVTGFNNWSLIRLAFFFVVVVAQHAANCPQPQYCWKLTVSSAKKKSGQLVCLNLVLVAYLQN